MGVSVYPTSMSVYRVHAWCQWKPHKGVGYTGTGARHNCKSYHIGAGAERWARVDSKEEVWKQSSKKLVCAGKNRARQGQDGTWGSINLCCQNFLQACGLLVLFLTTSLDEQREFNNMEADRVSILTVNLPRINWKGSFYWIIVFIRLVFGHVCEGLSWLVGGPSPWRMVPFSGSVAWAI